MDITAKLPYFESPESRRVNRISSGPDLRPLSHRGSCPSPSTDSALASNKTSPGLKSFPPTGKESKRKGRYGGKEEDESGESKWVLGLTKRKTAFKDERWVWRWGFCLVTEQSGSRNNNRGSAEGRLVRFWQGALDCVPALVFAAVATESQPHGNTLGSALLILLQVWLKE